MITFCRVLFLSLNLCPSLMTLPFISALIKHHSLLSASVFLLPSLGLFYLPFLSVVSVISDFTFHAVHLASSRSASSFLLAALLLSVCLTFLFLSPSLSFLSCLSVLIPDSLPPPPPPQFKYRGHFLPISPGARRAPRFAARRKVPVWTAVSAVMSL